MEGPSEKIKNSSVWLSEEQAESMEHVGNVLEDGNRRLRIMRTHDNRFFCELTKKPARQAATAILLKGIVPICDIKKVDSPEGTQYYSYIVPIDDELFSGEQTTEIQADTKVIDLLFNGEHWAGPHLKNIRLDKNHQAIIFDFDQSKFDFSLNKRQIIYALDYTAKVHPDALELIKGKLLTLKNRLEGNEGKDWFINALKHVGYDAQKDDLSLNDEEYQERLVDGGNKGRHPFRPDNDELLLRIRRKVDVVLEVISENY